MQPIIELIEQIDKSPFIITISSVLLGGVITGIGFLLKQLFKSKDKEEKIIQNFNTEVNYNKIKEIVEIAMEEKLKEDKSTSDSVSNETVNKKDK